MYEGIYVCRLSIYVISYYIYTPWRARLTISSSFSVHAILFAILQGNDRHTAHRKRLHTASYSGFDGRFPFAMYKKHQKTN